MRTSASSGSPPETVPTGGENAASLPDAPPPTTTTTATTATMATTVAPHPFFMKTSDKKRVFEKKQQEQQEQQQEQPRARVRARAPTPNPTSASDNDNEEQLPERDPSTSSSRPKRARKKATKPRKGKLPALPPRDTKDDARPSSSAMNLASVRTEIDPVTAAAAPLTPSSSVGSSVVGEEVASVGVGKGIAVVDGALAMDVDVVAETEMDPNRRKTKRRKKAAPVAPIVTTAAAKAPFRMPVDDEAGMIPSSSRASTPQKRGRLEVSRLDTKLVIRASSEVASELLPKNAAAMPPMSPMFPLPLLPSSPVLPPGGTMSGFSTPMRSSLKIRAKFDRESGMFTIVNPSSRLGDTSPTQRPPMSSPIMLPSSPPQQLRVGLPPVRNAFALLGKKKTPEKPPPARKKKDTSALEDSATIESKPAGKGRKPRSKKSDDKLPSPKDQTTAAADSKPGSTMITSNKPAHPFFSAAGRKKMKQTPADEDTKTEGTAITPPQGPSPGASKKRRERKGSWVFSSAFGNPAADRVAKNPALPEAPWPPRGTAHVRGLDTSDNVIAPAHTHDFKYNLKLKGSNIVVTAEEDILKNLASTLDLLKLKKMVSSEDYQTLKYLGALSDGKVPNRIITTGSLLQEMVRPRVSARLPHPKAMSQAGEDSDSGDNLTVGGMSVHPALFKLYQRLGTTLTAFDMHVCESSPWEVKYAPETASEILQTGREKDILRQWLIELRTDKVHVEKGNGGSGSGKGKRKGKPKAAAVKKKRKKKGDDLDGFMVDSEGEQSIMDEITDPEEDDWLNPTVKTKKSTVRSGDKMNELIGKTKDAKKTNSIVISGPTGSGKTAAVYATAKELGYVVFEVNAGTRRCGKDVLDQVGDMSRNHLVHQAKSASETNNPFSKAKTAAATPKDVVAKLEDEMQMRQKQSLILFEEVDILFDEDKSFWSTVITLMFKSKRPVVLTCNDESRLPWDDLSLHAILRFSVPPRALLVDHLLLMAANEGHLLQRSAVEGLVQANREDLRSSIMDLQFYCRMAVGDRKGGLDWMISRYPIGCDIADNGEKLRVVSEDTYCPGTGMVNDTQGFREEQKWMDVWEGYGLDVGASNEGIRRCVDAMPTDERADRLAALEISETFFGARSDADAFASLSGSYDDPKLDFSLPKRSGKTRLDDLCGYSILQTEPHIVPGSVETEITVYTRSLARSYLTSEVHKMSLTLPPLSNSTIMESITSRHEEDGVSRMQLQNLFAPLSKAETMFASTPATTHSCVYPSLRTLATEVAPYVRSILRFDIMMEKERRRASNLLSLGGKRKTRAARLAVEGGDRRRKERWLRGLGADVVGRSAGDDWVVQPGEEEDGRT